MPTILLVEDQLVFRENLAEALEDQGYSVVRAGSAEDAVTALDQKIVDLFILDVALPGMSGLELLRSLRSKSIYRRIPAFFLTAFARPEAMEEASKLGVGDFLVKSDISLRDLLERIQKGLSAGSDCPQPSTRHEPVETRRQIRPALRRWRPAPDRAQVKDLFELASGPCEADDLKAFLQIDPVGAKWLRRLAVRLETTDPAAAIRLLLIRAVADAAMRSVQPNNDLRRLWRRALATGLLAQAFHPHQAFASPCEAFLAGFCTQVPWIFAIQALETEYPEVKAEAWEDGRSITEQLAGAFGTDEPTLAMETVRGMDLPDRVWKAVIDVYGANSNSGMWDVGPGGRNLSIAVQLSVLVEPVWHPCVEVRGVDALESGWVRAPRGVMAELPGVERLFRGIVESDVFPEGALGDPTRVVPLVTGGRRFVYVREPQVLVPDPLELALQQLGEVELVASADDLLGTEDTVRVAWAEPGTPLWERLKEIPRRTVVLHHQPLPRGAAPGAHAHLRLPAPLAVLEKALRARE